MMVHGLRQTYHRLRNHFGCNRWYSYVTWVNWKLVSIHLKIVLISKPDRCTVCAECTMGMEIILGIPDGTLGDMGHVESCFGPFGESVSVRARYMRGLRQTYHRLRNHFECT